MSEKTRSRSATGSGTIALGGELTVNRLGFGAMRLTGDGIWGPPNDPARAIAVLRRAIELGVNFIDTADSYGPIPWFPLGAGRVAGRLLERIAKARQVKPIQIALAWLLKRSPVMLPIPGTSSIAHLEENIQAASLLLSENEYLELTGITELAS